MGSCISAGEGRASGAPTATATTAKVIGLGGELREFAEAVSAGEVLGSESSSCFLCSSDKLYSNDYIPAVDSGEVLQLGQIYFVLPIEKLRKALTQGEMTALAVKAISALAAAAEKDGRRRTVRVTVGASQDCEWGEEEINGFAPAKVVRRPPPLPAVQRKMKRSGSLKKTKNSSGYHRLRPTMARLLSPIPEFIPE